MTTHNPDQALAGVDLEGLQLAKPALMAQAPGSERAQQDDKESGTVVGNSLVSFTSQVSAQHKDDLNNALGLAQLVAVKQGNDPAEEPIKYYKSVATFLQNIGFTGQGISFGSYTARTKTVEIDRVVMEIMAAIVAPAELGIVEAALKALKSSANSGGAPWTIYDHHSTSNKAGTFTVGLANETNDSVAFQLSAFRFVGTETSTRFLWAQYSATSVSIEDGATALSFNESVYKRVRSSVLEKLGTHAEGYIANLPDL
ncbi:hypothetical protein [Cellulomonas bogoriensis]|uniref:Uncharacterized protein n=1 Tax=Cellulomonas bogoriensis 69B4 = DSM 16987 TaxID=1386082 RepID=A0A0A0BRM1_9CELL|nr:hypothetical protein [Cellulomonas bogoriensis]KGM10605.1 hypothetical protein N869_04420 [Cellulomonas bogoriensis 69B4 = DSM 16987]